MFVSLAQGTMRWKHHRWSMTVAAVLLALRLALYAGEWTAISEKQDQQFLFAPGWGDQSALYINRGPGSPRESNVLCPYAWLEEVASYSTDSYVLEHVLLNKLEQAACSPPAATALDRVLFVVMCSHDREERVAWLHQSWLSWIPPQNVVLLGDQELQGYNITLLPSLPVDAYLHAKFPNPSNYEAANLRHLKSVHWLGRVKKGALENIDWIFMVDDDTFVSPPMLLMLLRKIPPALPLLLGHMWDSPPELKGLAFPSGGAGMLFTKTAFKRLAVNLFEPPCEMRIFLNDVTIGWCTAASNITKVHSLKFQPERTQVTTHYNPVIQDAGEMISIHRVVEWQHVLDYTCLVSTRFDWPHPLCGNVSVPCDPACHMGKV